MGTGVHGEALFRFWWGSLCRVLDVCVFCAGEVTDPELVAVGTGTFQFDVEFNDGAPPLVTNTVNGTVRTNDGDNGAVNGYAEIVFDPGPEAQEPESHHPQPAVGPGRVVA